MKRLLLVLFLLVLVAAAAAGGWYLWRERQVTEFAQRPVSLPAEVVVSVPPGTGPRALATLLHREGVVASADLFYRFVRREQAGPRLKAGEYGFDGTLTPRQVLDRIVSGQVKVYRFTVPEGLRADEILPIVAASGLALDRTKLERLARDPAFLRRVGVPAERIEGFLYPDTYTFTRSATEEAVLTRMVQRTLEEYRKADQQRDPAVRLGMMEAVTLASIVEKETGQPQERPRISCVFHNRLHKGIPLATDPTVLYAKWLRVGGPYSKNITSKDLREPHPYNTYVVKGLPPGPIASPGAAALQAALRPITCDDLFFVSRNDGTHIFCPTLACHEAAVKEWQVEYFRRKKRGG